MITASILLFTLFLMAFLFHLVGENAKLRKDNETLIIERDNLRNRVDVMHSKQMEFHRDQRNKAINTYIGKNIL